MQNKTYHIVYTGIFAVLLAICSWLSVPTLIPFTLQTFGVFFTILMLGGKQGTFSILIYLLLGAVGIPVFSNFGAGLGYLLGNTGGYIIGFLLIGCSSWISEKFFGKKRIVQIVSLMLGLFLCYAFGTFWFMKISFHSGTIYGLTTVLTMCVFPFVLPDLAKLWLACILSRRILPFLKIK